MCACSSCQCCRCLLSCLTMPTCSCTICQRARPARPCPRVCVEQLAAPAAAGAGAVRPLPCAAAGGLVSRQGVGGLLLRCSCRLCLALCCRAASTFGPDPALVMSCEAVVMLVAFLSAHRSAGRGGVQRAAAPGQQHQVQHVPHLAPLAPPPWHPLHRCAVVLRQGSSVMRQGSSRQPTQMHY